MQTIAQRHTQHYSSYSQSHQRHAALQHIHARQSKQSTIDDRKHQQNGVARLTQAQGEKQKDNNQRDADSHTQVLFYPAGVISRLNHCTMIINVNLRIRRLNLFDGILYVLEQLAGGTRVHRAQVRTDKTKTGVAREQMVLTESRRAGLCPLRQVERQLREHYTARVKSHKIVEVLTHVGV